MPPRQKEVTLAWLACDMSNAEAAKALRITNPRNVYWKMGANARKLEAADIRKLYERKLKSLKPLKVRGTVN